MTIIAHINPQYGELEQIHAILTSAIWEYHKHQGRLQFIARNVAGGNIGYLIGLINSVTRL